MGLIVTRRKGEVVCIGDDIQVCVLDISGAQVKILIEAPKHISVDREEIRKRKNLEDDNLNFNK